MYGNKRQSIFKKKNWITCMYHYFDFQVFFLDETWNKPNQLLKHKKNNESEHHKQMYGHWYNLKSWIICIWHCLHFHGLLKIKQGTVQKLTEKYNFTRIMSRFAQD